MNPLLHNEMSRLHSAELDRAAARRRHASGRKPNRFAGRFQLRLARLRPRYV
jgi:hypothetical protein